MLATTVAVANAQSAAMPAPLTFRQAVRAALEKSPMLHPALDRLAVAEIRQELAESRYGFRVTPSARSLNAPPGFSEKGLGVEISRRLPIGTDIRFEAGVVGSSNRTGLDTGYTVGLRHPLLHTFSPATRAELDDAARAMTGASRSFAEARQDLIVQVAHSYFGIVRQQRLVASAARSLDRAAKLRAASAARARVGLATQLDLLRADLLASQAEAALALQRETLASGFDELAVLLGLPPDQQIDIEITTEVTWPTGRDPIGARDDADALTRLALDRRHDVRERRDRVGDARRHQEIARWNLLPDVTLDVAYSERQFAGPDARLLERLSGGWRVGFSSRYALDRADLTAARGFAAVSVRSAEQSLLDLERQVRADVRRAYRARERAIQSEAIQQKAVELAERQLRLAELRYERGIAGSFDVVDAESNLLQAESALIGAQVDSALATLALARVTGTLNPEAFVP